MQENYVAVADKVKLWTCVSGVQHNTAIMLCSGGPGSADYLESCLALLYMSGNGIQNDRIWSEEYHKNRSAYGELMPESPYPANKEVNRLGNLSWRNFIQNPQLLENIARLKVPSLFLYGSKDIRPSWPAEQVSNLLLDSTWVMIEGATHYTWLIHASETREQLRKFVIPFTGE